MPSRAFRTVGPRQVIVTAVGLAVSALASALLAAGPALLRPDWWIPVAALASGVYVLLGGSVGRGAELSFAPDLLAFMAGMTTFFAVNTVAYATIISVTGEDGWWLSWKKVRDELNIVFDVGVGVLTFLVAHLYLDWGTPALALLAVPLVGAHVFTTVQTHLHEVLWDLVSMLVTLLEKQDPIPRGTRCAWPGDAGRSPRSWT